MSSKVVISDIAEIIMGQSPKKKDVNEVGDGYPLLNGPTEFTERYPEPVQFTTDGRRFSDFGDILFCVRGSTTGRMNYADQPYAIGRGIAAIRGKDGYPTPFVRAVIENNLDRLLAAATGSTFPNVSKSLLNEFDVDVISPDEAQSVNEILVSLESKIHLNQQTNETLEAMAQAIFKSWFVDFDPVRAKMEARSAGRDPNRAAMAAITGVNLDQSWDEIEAALEKKLSRMSHDQLTQLRQTTELFPGELVESGIGVVPKGWGYKEAQKIANIGIGKTPPRKEKHWFSSSDKDVK
jgi:type I restriction enzyme S subunit